eukprot:GDKJ01051615.1.p1 GENE.GDKJ01051615.1~~GDKJ01051615.1.p1  ORF type:complete len:513 (+),score=84.50 GDKJ01051615.1:42-1580(+)
MNESSQIHTKPNDTGGMTVFLPIEVNNKMAALFSKFSRNRDGVTFDYLIDCIERTASDGYHISSNAVNRVFFKIAKGSPSLSFHEFLRFVTVMSLKRFPHLSDSEALSRFIDNLALVYLIDNESSSSKHMIEKSLQNKFKTFQQSRLQESPNESTHRVHRSPMRTIETNKHQQKIPQTHSSYADYDNSAEESRDHNYLSPQNIRNQNRRMYSSQHAPQQTQSTQLVYEEPNKNSSSLSIVHQNLLHSPKFCKNRVGRPVKQWPGWERVSPTPRQRPNMTPSPPRTKPQAPSTMYPYSRPYSPATPNLAQAARERFLKTGPPPPKEQFALDTRYVQAPPPSTVYPSPPRSRSIELKPEETRIMEEDEADLPTVVHEPALDRNLAIVFDMLANPNTNQMDHTTFTKLIKKTGITSFGGPRIAMADVDVSFAQVRRQNTKGIDLGEFKEVLALVAWRARNTCTCAGKNAPIGASQPNQVIHAVGCGREEGGVAYYRLANTIVDIGAELRQKVLSS